MLPEMLKKLWLGENEKERVPQNVESERLIATVSVNHISCVVDWDTRTVMELSVRVLIVVPRQGCLISIVNSRVAGEA